MADDPKHDNPADTHRITPPDVEPDRRKGGGDAVDRSKSDDRGMRHDPPVVDLPLVGVLAHLPTLERVAVEQALPAFGGHIIGG